MGTNMCYPNRPRGHQTRRTPSVRGASVEWLEARRLLSANPTGMVFSAVEGSSFAGTVATFTTTDNVSLSAKRCAATIDWGDGHTTRASVKAGPLVAGQCLVAGRHVYMDEGTYHVTVSIHDGIDKTNAAVTSWADVKDAQLYPSARPVNVSAGQAFTRLVATFHNLNRFDPLDDFVTAINWGDGSSSTGRLAGGHGNFKVTGAHTYAAKGSFNITVKIIDLSGTSATVVGAANVK